MMAAILTLRQLILELLKTGDLDDAVCINQGSSSPDYVISEVTDNGFFGVIDIRFSPLNPDFHSFIASEPGKELLDQQGFLKDTEKDHWGSYDSTIEGFLKFILERNIPLNAKMTVPMEGCSPMESFYLEYNKKENTINVTYS